MKSKTDNTSYLKELGARILGEANDLKRTPEALAQDLGWHLDEVRDVINGAAAPERARELLMTMADIYPISLRDLWVEPDDTDSGVRHMRADESLATSRIFRRIDRSGALTDYYEYRDTALSASAPYKPEWIKELRCVEDSDPNNPDVAYNNGHLMHQMTFFIGQVNFYWETKGKKHCAEITTGDSCYITPFVPHSFTSRNPDEPGLIIAVTYGARVRSALGTLAKLEPGSLAELVGDSRERVHVFATKLKRFRDGASISESELARRLLETGITENRAHGLSCGQEFPDADERVAIAGTLGIHESDLAIKEMPSESEVAVRHAADTRARPYPDSNRPAYTLKELAQTIHQPCLRGFDIEFSEGQGAESWFSHVLHEYAYNYGTQDVILHWGEKGRQAILAPGDSAYIRPTTKFRYSGPEEAHIATVRVPGEMTEEMLAELSCYNPNERARVVGESNVWF